MFQIYEIWKFSSLQQVKDKILAHVEAEAEQWLGCAMTYTLFQAVSDNVEDFLSNQPSTITQIEDSTEKLKITDADSPSHVSDFFFCKLMTNWF